MGQAIIAEPRRSPAARSRTTSACCSPAGIRPAMTLPAPGRAVRPGRERPRSGARVRDAPHITEEPVECTGPDSVKSHVKFRQRPPGCVRARPCPHRGTRRVPDGLVPRPQPPGQALDLLPQEPGRGGQGAQARDGPLQALLGRARPAHGRQALGLQQAVAHLRGRVEPRSRLARASASSASAPHPPPSSSPAWACHRYAASAAWPASSVRRAGGPAEGQRLVAAAVRRQVRRGLAPHPGAVLLPGCPLGPLAQQAHGAPAPGRAPAAGHRRQRQPGVVGSIQVDTPSSSPGSRSSARAAYGPASPGGSCSTRPRACSA